MKIATVRIDKISPNPTLWLHPEVAQQAGLRDGDTVEVSVTPSGSIVLVRKQIAEILTTTPV